MGTLANGKAIKIQEYPRIDNTTNSAAPGGADIESAFKGGKMAGVNAPGKVTKIILSTY